MSFFGLVAILILGFLIGHAWARFSWQLDEAQQLADKAIEARSKIENNEQVEKIHRQDALKHRMNAFGWILVAVLCVALTTALIAFSIV